MARTLPALAVLPWLLLPVASAAPPATYPDGYSVQTFENHRFELLVPDGLDRTQPCSLLVAIHGADDVARSYAGLLSSGFVVFAPKANAPKSAAGFPTWSAGEAKDILKILDALAKSFPVGKERIHIVAYGDAGSLLSLMAFGPDSRFASACFVDAPYRGGSVAPRSKRALGVLAYAGDYEGRHGGKKALDVLDGKVRTLEYRKDSSGVQGDYFAFWVKAMEGRFAPGEDLSLPWKTEPVAPDALAAEATKGGKGALAWLCSPEDVTKPEGKILQSEVFLDARVREAAADMLAVKINVKATGAALGAFHATATPTLLVYDRKGAETSRFSGKFDPSAIASALAVVSGKAPKK